MQHSRLLVKPNPSAVHGRVVHVTPKSAGWSYVGFDLYRTPNGDWSSAGPRRVRSFHSDPAHEWILEPPSEGTAIVERRRVSC